MHFLRFFSLFFIVFFGWAHARFVFASVFWWLRAFRACLEIVAARAPGEGIARVTSLRVTGASVPSSVKWMHRARAALVAAAFRAVSDERSARVRPLFSRPIPPSFRRGGPRGPRLVAAQEFYEYLMPM